MKIAISNESQCAHFYERVGLARAFAAAQHDVVIWDINAKSSFDLMDEFQPDILITQTYNIDTALEKCIRERPFMYVAAKASDWGAISESIDLQKYPILVANKDEKKRITKLFSDTCLPNFLFIHYHPDYIDETHTYWKKEIPVFSSMNASDVFDYTNGVYRPEFESDIAFVGGYWPYKSRTLDRYILPLCHPDSNLKIKIFGNQGWSVTQYHGFIDNRFVKDVFASSKICPNVSEPHSQDFGFDIIERPFKLLSNKCFVISDKVEGMTKLFNNNEMVFADNPKDFLEKVQFYLYNPAEKQKFINNGYETVLKGHTYFDRASDFMARFGLLQESKKILEAKNRVFGELNL